jgi:hypothetical protein
MLSPFKSLPRQCSKEENIQIKVPCRYRAIPYDKTNGCGFSSNGNRGAKLAFGFITLASCLLLFAME